MSWKLNRKIIAIAGCPARFILKIQPFLEKSNIIFQLLTSQNPVFFQPDTRISIQIFSLSQYMEFHDK